MFNLFYRNCQLLILTLALIVVWGLSAFFTLPRLEDPEITQRFSTVTTFFPGASADRVESLVTDPIETELLEIEEVDEVASTSSTGVSVVQIELKDTIANVDPVWAKVRSQIDDVVPQLPTGTSEPKYEDGTVKASSLIVGLTWELETPPNYTILRRVAEGLEDQLRGIPGTDKVELFGNPDEEILVEIAQADLTDLGITAQNLAQQIQASDAKVSAGQVRSDRNEFLLEINSELDSLGHIRQIPIQVGAGGQGAQLGDLAQVSKGVREPVSDLTLVNGVPAVVIAVTVESSQRVDQWAVLAQQQLAEFQTQLSDGMGLHVVLDQSHYVKQRLNGVIGNLILGSGLVLAISLVILGWKSALIVSSALPLATLMVFGWMSVLGIPLHQMSITGLIIALGLLIDNAIVVVDEVQTQLRVGTKPAIAINHTVRHLAIPLLASTLTTVLAFVPIAVSPGSTGEFIGTIGSTVILALLSSLLLSLTVIPALTGLFHRWQPFPSRAPVPAHHSSIAISRNQKSNQTLNPLDNHKDGGGIEHQRPPELGDLGGEFRAFNTTQTAFRNSSWWRNGFSHPHLTAVYAWSLSHVFRRPLLGILLSLILPIVGFVQFSTLEQQFFPPSNRDQFQVEFELPAQSAIAQTQAQVLKVRELMRQHPDVEEVHWFIGKSAPSFFYNVIGNRENAADYAQGLVQLRSTKNLRQTIQTLQAQLDRAFPQAQVLVRQLEQGPPFPAPIEVELYGADMDQLRQLGNQLREQLTQTEDVIHTRADLTEALPKLALTVDEAQARRVGLDNDAIARQLNFTLEGAIGGSLLEATEDLPVRVRLSDAQRGDVGELSALDLLPTNGSARPTPPTIPLSAVADVNLVPGLATISHLNGQRLNNIQAFITAGALPDTVLTRFKQQLAASNFSLPPGYRIAYGGEADARGSAVGGLLSTIGILTILITATLVLSFNSFALAGLIAVVAVLGIGLAAMALWMFNSLFGFTAILGTLGLVGLAINDSIVVLAALRADPLARQGNVRATQAVVLKATRHVVATTLTTIMGFVPLMLDQTGFWPPLAIAIAGGLGGATVLALYFIPSAYLLLHRQPQQASERRVIPPDYATPLKES